MCEAVEAGPVCDDTFARALVYDIRMCEAVIELAFDIG
jgi:hypothetical protein